MAKVRVAKALASAEKFLDEGRPAIAELLLRDLDAEGEDADRVAALKKRSVAELGLPKTKTRGGPRYVVIREWMEGFWSDVDHVLGACVVAEAAGRFPIVHWGAQSRYASVGGGNAWLRFFLPVSDTSIDSLPASATIYPPKWSAADLEGIIETRGIGLDACSCSLEILSREEDVVVSDYHCGVAEFFPYITPDHPVASDSLHETRRLAVARYLKPAPDIIAKVDEFAERNFGGGPILAVHLRALDKVFEQDDLSEINTKYPDMIEAQLTKQPDMKLFLMTDSQEFANWCCERYGTRVVMTTASRSDGQVGLHHRTDVTDPSDLGVEVLVDTLLAARCDSFVGLASSNVSVFVRDLRSWPAGTCTLLGYAHSDRPYLSLKTHPRPPKPPRHGV